ncbi:ROK family transcriptional regulator [Streptomyces sp. RB6PN25]|uniref:ROK family transcriptional regulator n=1 Tax=Streptomyces humicola TaxID=2953240 RepID=A0ABT1Q0K9_9ACTN|nr:ROK family transcriptional regulator [Streptomyces humicola]MCQ4082325.1 ROK family transcriptional regulator [Streptomyces humicola]
MGADEPGPGTQPWNHGVLRSFNERTLLEALRAAGTSSRAELARTTGLSKPTVSAALANLERAGLVRQTGEVSRSQGRGRAAVLYEANPAAGFVVGVDVGREWIRAAAADLDGTIVGRRDAPNTARTASAMVRGAARLARTVVEETGLDWAQVVHTVVGSPGVTDPGTHRVRYAANLPGWGRSGLFERLRDELGTGLDVVNDANLAALGEYAVGAGQGSRLFAYLWIGTGLGAGLVADGKLFRGGHGAAGEIGYLPMSPLPVENEASADRGTQAEAAARRGTLEGAVSADAVVRLAHAMGMTGARSAKDVFAAARAADAVACRVVEHEAGRLAHAVAALAAVVDPELVVLGGGIGRNTDLLLGPLRSTLRDLTPLRPRVVPSALGDDAVLLGAVATAADVARDRVFNSRVR